VEPTEAVDSPTLIRGYALEKARTSARPMFIGEVKLNMKNEVLIYELGLEQNVALPIFRVTLGEAGQSNGIFVMW
jgi:hypothetical protein